MLYDKQEERVRGNNISTSSYSDSKEKLIEDLIATEGSTSKQFDIAKAILDVKCQEDISKQTKKLTIATWALVIATIGLVISTITSAIYKY